MKTAALAAVLCAAAVVAFADHIPIAPNGILEYEGRTALIVQTGPFDFLADITGRFEDTNHDFRYRALTIGGYYRLLKNLKAGAFYSLQAGVRHDDDWVANPAPPPPG